MRWSRLKSLVEDLFVPELRLQLHCTGIREDARKDPSRTVARGVLQVRLGREIIWDFPGRFLLEDDYSATDLTALLRDYLDTPKAALLEREFENDPHGLVDVLRLTDRRIGLRRLREQYGRDDRPFVVRLLQARGNVVSPDAANRANTGA